MNATLLAKTHIQFNTPNNIHYYDEGVVDNLDKHIRELYHRYGHTYKECLLYRFSEHPLIYPRYRKILLGHGGYEKRGHALYEYGSHASLDDALKAGDEVNIHTFVPAGFNEQTTVFLKGHEEGHVILDLNDYLPNPQPLNTLIAGLSKYGINGLTLPSEEEETICNVIGFYAVMVTHPGKHLDLKVMNDNIIKMVSWLRNNGCSWSFSQY